LPREKILAKKNIGFAEKEKKLTKNRYRFYQKKTI
jgi:hypothetical protein